MLAKGGESQRGIPSLVMGYSEKARYNRKPAAHSSLHATKRGGENLREHTAETHIQTPETNIQVHAVFTVLRATASATAQATMHHTPQAPAQTPATPKEHTNNNIPNQQTQTL
jgi:hypothetical protein